MKKIISIVGARPQFIKSFPLLKELEKHFKVITVHTGQHFDLRMSDIFFKELNISPPDYNLCIKENLHGKQTGKMLIGIENILIKEKPDLIIVYGDTNTTLAGSVAGAKLHIPIIHIEAGLRSYNKLMPEEINRIITDHVSDYLFAPTITAMENLKKENLSSKSYLTGDIMADSLKIAQKIVKKIKIKPSYPPISDFNLLTLHRPYNVDIPFNLQRIFNELKKINGKIIFPVHPRTKKKIKINRLNVPKNIILIEPVGYLEFIGLQMNSKRIITDSGGIQKEAYILKKPCVTLRSETEWIETVKAGWNLLINPFREKNYKQKIEIFLPVNKNINIFGNNTAFKMTKIIKKILV